MFEPLLPREGDGLKAASWGLLGDQGAGWVFKEVMGLALACLPTQVKSC